MPLRMYPDTRTLDEEFEYLRESGYTGALNDMMFDALGDLGYSSLSLPERLFNFGGEDLFLNVAGYVSGYGLDFTNGRYYVDTESKDFSDAVTFSRASTATMVDSDGTMKWAPHNLLTYSEQFDNAVWDKGGETLIANDAAAPDGTQTADKLVADGTSKNHRCRQIVSTNINTSYSFGVWVKNVDATAILVTLTYSGAAGYYHAVVVDPADWTISQKSTGANSTEISSAVTEGVDGWALVKITAKSNSDYAFNNAAVSLVDATTGNNFATIGTGYITSTEDGSAYIWGAHLYRSDLGGMVNNPDRGDSYVPTTSSAVYLPRIGHHVWNGSEWVNEGLLLESEARTNLVPYSEDKSQWTQTSVNDEASATLSNGIGGLGFSDSDMQGYRVFDVSNGAWIINQTAYDEASAGVVNRQVVSFTAPVGCTSVHIYAAIDAAGSQYTRITLPVVAEAQYTFSFYHEVIGAEYRVGGIQLEAAQTPSSYIPTSGSQATRAAETLVAPSANLPWSSDAVSLQMKGRMTYADDVPSTEAVFVRRQIDANNRIENYLISNGATTGQSIFLQSNAGTTDLVASSGTYYSPGILVPFNIASRHGSTFINGAVDGTALTENDTPTALPDLSSTDLQIGYDFMGTISEFRVWAADLGDAGIVEASQ